MLTSPAPVAAATLFAFLALVACSAATPLDGSPAQIVQPQHAANRSTKELPRLVRGQPRLVVLGDSVPSGEGCQCVSFGRLLAQRLATATGRPTALSNLSQAGLTSGGLRQQLTDSALMRRLATATIVTVTIGANDFDPDLASRTDCVGTVELPCYRSGLAALPTTMAAILGRIHTLQPAGGLLLVTGYWNVFLDGEVGMVRGGNYVATSDALTRAVNAVLERASTQAHARYVDLYAPFENRSLVELSALLAPDGDHPSARGHEVIATELMSAVTAAYG